MKNLKEQKRPHAGFHPVVRRNVGHLLLNLLVTISIIALLVVALGLPGLITFIQWYIFSAFILIVFFDVLIALVKAIMNTLHKSLNLPSKPFILSYDEVLEFEGALPYINTERIVFMIVALAFIAKGEVAPDNGFGAASSLMIAFTALFSMVADAIPLLIMIRFRKDAAQ